MSKLTAKVGNWEVLMKSPAWKGWRSQCNFYNCTRDIADFKAAQALRYYEGCTEFKLRPLRKLTQEPSPSWTYSHYRALLRYKGEPFAIVTPDGFNALPPDKVAILLKAMNRLETHECPGQLTKAQLALQAKHGTPEEFAREVKAAVPDYISNREAGKAVKRYLRDWEAARGSVPPSGNGRGAQTK